MKATSIISAVSSKTAGRFQIQGARLRQHPEDGLILEATNGHCYGRRKVILTGEPSEATDDGMISAAALKELEKKGRVFQANGTVRVSEKTGDSGTIFERPDVKFPNLDGIKIPKEGDEGTVTIWLDAEYLLAVARAICLRDPKSPSEYAVRVTFRPPAESAPNVSMFGIQPLRNDDGIGVVMGITK